MKRQVWLAVGLLGLGAFVGLLLAGADVEASGSTLSRGPGGWLATRVYLEERGIATHRLDGPLGEAPAGAVLALVFPWQHRRGDVDLEAVRAHLAAGGVVLVAYASDLAPSAAEAMVLDAVGASIAMVRQTPVAPWRWREDGGVVKLSAARHWRGASDELTLRRLHWAPLPPSGSLLMDRDGYSVAATWKQGAGRVVVVPAELLCNARLRAAPNAALLETIAASLPRVWAFDELHHGVVRPGAPLPEGPRRGFDLLLVQLALLYAAAALALARRLGPAWREAPPLLGHAAAFLLRLGKLHHRLGHHRDGAALLLRRATELDRRLVPGPELAALAERGDAEAFVELAQRLAPRGGPRGL
jgi:hypothetical protein